MQNPIPKDTKPALLPLLLKPHKKGSTIANPQKEGDEKVLTELKHNQLSRNPNWKGGVRIKHGYIQKNDRQHPYHDVDGYVMIHRLIYENYLSILFDETIYIPKNYEVHHINEQKGDNRLINLTLLSSKEHRQLHKNGKKDMSNRFCLICNNVQTYIDKNGYQYWTKYQDGFICHKCNLKIRDRKKRLR